MEGITCYNNCHSSSREDFQFLSLLFHMRYKYEEGLQLSFKTTIACFLSGNLNSFQQTKDVLLFLSISEDI